MTDDARKLIESHNEQRQQLTELRREAQELSLAARNGEGKSRDDIIAEIDALDAALADKVAQLRERLGETIH